MVQRIARTLLVGVLTATVVALLWTLLALLALKYVAFLSIKGGVHG